MYNKGTIIPGLIIFVLFVTFPVWYNGLKAGPIPKPELPPNGTKHCVYPTQVMRDDHPQILNEWRDDVLRNDDRVAVTVDGKSYRKGLQLACLKCHSNPDKFCDRCHEYASVKPYCWDCHLRPSDIAKKNKETH